MLLAINANNTNTVFAVWDGDKLKGVGEAKRARLAVIRDKRPFPNERLNVAGSGVGACKTEMPGNFTMCGTRPSRRQFSGDEIADGFLFFAQICHDCSFEQ